MVCWSVGRANNLADTKAAMYPQAARATSSDHKLKVKLHHGQPPFARAIFDIACRCCLPLTLSFLFLLSLSLSLTLAIATSFFQ